MTAKYCPECRRDCGTPACPATAEGRCATCGKPPVEASGKGHVWFWCRDHDQWHQEACSADRHDHCCTAAAA